MRTHLDGSMPPIERHVASSTRTERNAFHQIDPPLPHTRPPSNLEAGQIRHTHSITPHRDLERLNSQHPAVAGRVANCIVHSVCVVSSPWMLMLLSRTSHYGIPTKAKKRSP
ncbi:hypothetical protein IG631_03839 [Alternaria alternata]|nr:hypothetical protein IG631_03839 [Alternaria alternata]